MMNQRSNLPFVFLHGVFDEVDRDFTGTIFPFPMQSSMVVLNSDFSLFLFSMLDAHAKIFIIFHLFSKQTLLIMTSDHVSEIELELLI